MAWNLAFWILAALFIVQSIVFRIAIGRAYRKVDAAVGMARAAVDTAIVSIQQSLSLCRDMKAEREVRRLWPKPESRFSRDPIDELIGELEQRLQRQTLKH